MTPPRATNLIVPGRGHETDQNGRLTLSASAVQRVLAASVYFGEYQEAFEEARANEQGGVIVLSGGYASLATGNKLSPPPYALRESTLMVDLAVTAGIPDEYLRSSASSTSTMENILRVHEEGLLGGLSTKNPLGIVTQPSQWDRLHWFAQRIFKLPAGAVQLIPALGEEDEKILREERKLMYATKVLYSLAKTPYGLRRAERVGATIATTAIKLGLQQPPASTYLRSNH